MAAPYMQQESGAPRFYDLGMTVTPLVFYNGSYYPLQDEYMHSLAQLLQHDKTLAQDIIGQPPVVQLVSLVFIPGLKFMKFVYRVKTMDNLELIWKLCVDQTLNERFTSALRNIPSFAKSMGLDPRQLYMELEIDEKEYYLAKACLLRPKSSNKSRFVQGRPTFGPWTTAANPSPMTGVQAAPDASRTVVIPIEHQCAVAAPPALQMGDPPIHGMHLLPDTSSAGLSDSGTRQSAGDQQALHPQTQRQEPEGHSVESFSSEEEHTAVNFQGSSGDLDVGQQYTSGQGVSTPSQLSSIENSHADMNTSGGQSLTHPPGFEINHFEQGSQMLVHKSRDSGSTLSEKHEQVIQPGGASNEQNVTTQEEWVTPPNSPLSRRMQGNAVQSEEMNDRRSTLAETVTQFGTSFPAENKNNQDKKRDSHTSPENQVPKTKTDRSGRGNGQEDSDRKDANDNVVGDGPQAQTTGQTGNAQQKIVNQGIDAEHRRKEHIVKIEWAVTQVAVASQAHNHALPSAGTIQRHGGQGEDEGEENADNSSPCEEFCSPGVKKTIHKFENMEKMEEAVQKSPQTTTIPIIQTTQLVTVELQVYVSSEYGKIRNVQIESDHPDLQDVVFIQSPANSRIWISTRIQVPMHGEIIYYKYKIQGKDGMFRKFWKSVTGSSDISQQAERYRRDLKLNAVQRDVYANHKVAAGHFAFMAIMLQQGSLKTKDELVACRDMGYPKRYDRELSTDAVVSFVEEQVKKLGHNISVEQCIFLVAVLADGISSNIWISSLSKPAAMSLLNGLQDCNNCMLPSESKKSVKNIAPALCHAALSRSCWLDVVTYFYPLVDVDMILSLKLQSSHIKLAGRDTLLTTVKKLCGYPDSCKLIDAIVKDSYELELLLQIHSIIEASRVTRDGEKEQLLQCTSNAAMKLVKAECQNIVTRSSGIQKLADIANSLIQNMDVAHACCGIVESYTINSIDYLDSERAYRINGDVVNSIQNIALQSWLFKESDSATKLLVTMSKSNHRPVCDLTLKLLDHSKFRILEESDVQDIATRWMEKCQTNCGGNLKKPAAICKYYKFLVMLLNCDLVVHYSQVSIKLEEEAMEKLQRCNMDRVFQYAQSMDEEVQAKIYEHADQAGEDVPLSEALLGKHEVPILNSWHQARMLERALSGTSLAHEVDINSLDSALTLAQRDIFNNIDFWDKLMKAEGSLATKIKSNPACKNMQRVLCLITQSIENGTITVQQFRHCKSALNKFGEQKSIDFIGSNQGSGGLESPKWEKLYLDSIELEQKAAKTLEDIESLLSFLHMEFQQDIHLIDLVDMKKQMRECKENMVKGESVSLKSLHGEPPQFLQAIGELHSAAAALVKLKFSAVFLNICKVMLPKLDAKKNFVVDTEESIDAAEDLQGASLLFGNSAEQHLEEVNTDEELEGTTTCKLLAEFLATDCVDEYSDIFLESLYKKKDMSIRQIEDKFPQLKDIPYELSIAQKYFNRKLPDMIHDAFKKLLEFRPILKRTHTAEKVLKLFGFNEAQDNDFMEAANVAKNFELAGQSGSTSLFSVSSAYTQIIGALGNLEEDHWSLLEELSHSSKLVGFLQEIIEEDLRNLVDAVEDSSDQQIQSTTVSDFIQVKQFIKSVVKGFNGTKVADFFIQIKKAADGSKEKTAKYRAKAGSKDMAAKLKVCSSNFFGLKSLYLNVANRGEATREIIHNALNNGVIHFEVDAKAQECSVHLRYLIRKEKVVYDLSELEDLRSRAFLLLSRDKTRRYQHSDEGKKKSVDVEGFIDMVDLMINARDLIEDLHGDGHFDYRNLAKNISGSKQDKLGSLKILVEELANKQENWRNVLQSARSTYFFLNFIFAEQFLILHDFFLQREELAKVTPILRSIHPDVDLSSDLQAAYCMSKSNNKELDILISLGEALQKIFSKLKPRQRPFPGGLTPGSQEMTAVVPSEHVYVAKLDSNSQNVIPVVLSLYAATCRVLPEAWQLMFCHDNSSWDEVHLLLQRCRYAAENGHEDDLFCLANVEQLPGDYLLKLIDELKSMVQLAKDGAFSFRLAVVCRGPIHHPVFDHFSQDIHLVRGLPDKAVVDCLKELCSAVSVVTSEVPGLGKSEYITNKAAESDKRLSVMTISGPMTRAMLVRRLTETKVSRNCLLHLDIADVSDCELLDIFVFELLVMGQASYRTQLVQLQTDYVAIEIANTLHEYLKDALVFTSRLPSERLEWIHFKDFYHAGDEVCSSVQVVCLYLEALDCGMIDKVDIRFRGPNAKRPLSQAMCQQLLSKYLGACGDVSFAVCDIFLSVLAQQLRKMSASVYFSKSNLEAMLGTEEPLQVRSDLVRALIEVCSEFACRSVSSCRTSQEAALEKTLEQRETLNVDVCVPFEKQRKSDWMANRTKGMIRWEDSNHLMIVFHHDNQTVSALYRDLKRVPKQIQSLFQNQLGRPLPDFNSMTSDQLQQILEKLAIGKSASQDKKHLDQLRSTYALTPDNLLKMVLILLRIQARIPVVIMGETGCGKTSLVRYLATTCGISFSDENVIPFHAGVSEEHICEKVLEMHEKALVDLKKPIWIFLDEINTCEHLGLLCQIICHHSCNGKTLADNMTFIAACNPYRLRENHKHFTAGLEGKIKADEYSKLVYRVHPLPEALIDYVWDYGTLHSDDERTYIARMISKTIPSYKADHKLVDILAKSQEFMRNTEATVECVSLRDVDRCKKLMKWFHGMLEEKAKYPIGQVKVAATGCLTLAERAIVLALAHCYHSRISRTAQRKEYLKLVAFVLLGAEDKSKLISDTIFEEQLDLLDRMELPDGIAKNTALRENVFVVLVCILNRIPVFVVGKPGSSKSLSLQLLRSNLRGQDSEDAYFKTLPQLLVVSYQGSESSTSEGIIKIFKKAKSYQQNNAHESVLPVVLLDEIGLAEISRFNPLKVLHNLLEPVSGKDPDVAVVGISNWSLDAAKMNRAVHLSRPELDAEELLDTGKSISTIVEKSYWLSTESQKKLAVDEDILKAISIAFHEYQERQKVKNFHGLRDYYSLIKHLSKHLREETFNSLKEGNKQMEIIQRGILRNFGGQDAQSNDILNIFFHNLKRSRYAKEIGVEDLIRENLDDKEARHLMVITSGGSAMGVLQKIIREQNRECETIIGSMFDEDQTEDYSYRILSRIILVMERGCVLILKDLDTIYGSLYDMLNQNYTRVGGKRNCRIALGPFSNPMCHVHEDFRCIVLVDEHKVDYSDPPFLNRFEKQLVRYGDVLTEPQERLRRDLELWVTNASTVEGLHFTPEDCFVGYHKDTLPTLVLQNCPRDVQEEDLPSVMEACKETLLWTATPASIVRLPKTRMGEADGSAVEKSVDTYFHRPQHVGLPAFLEYVMQNPQEASNTLPSLWQGGTGFIKQLIEEDQEVPSFEGGSPGYRLVVYTNSSLLCDFTSDLPPDLKVQIEKLSSFKSERQLTLAIKHFWFESDAQLLMVHCKPSLDAEHLQLAKYQIENCRSEFQHSGNRLYTNKDVCIVVHMDLGKEIATGQWQFNYLSGWQIVTIDDIEQHPERETLMDILESDHIEILQSRALPVHKCIQEQMLWAFSCLKHSNCPRTPQETTDLVKMLCNSDEFMETIIKQVLRYLVVEDNECDRKGNFLNPDSWQVLVSCDASLLSNAATFRNALLNFITKRVQVPLAKIVFKLDSASAWYSFFTNEDLMLLWKDLFALDSWFSTQAVVSPHGLECYSVQEPPLKLVYPFSRTLYQRLESNLSRVQEDLDKVYMDPSAVDEFQDLKPEYQERLVEQFAEYFKNKAPELFDRQFAIQYVDELIHDVCNIVSEPYHMDVEEESRIHVCQWILKIKNQSSKAVGEYKLVASLLTLWHYHSLMEDVLQLLAFCKTTVVEDVQSLLLGIVQKEEEAIMSVEKSQESENVEELMDTTSDEQGFAPYESFCEDHDMKELSEGNVADQEDLLPEELFVNKLCSELLPTENVIDRCGGVDAWQMVVNRLLSFSSRISSYPRLLHVLRLCNDYVSLIQLPHNLDEAYLLCLASKARENETDGLDSPDLFKYIEVLMETLSKEVPWQDIQHFLCQYFGRIMDLNPQSCLLFEILRTVMNFLEEHSESFVGPIIHRLLISVGKEEYLKELLYICPAEGELDDYPTLQCLQEYLERGKPKAKKKLMVLCSDVIQMLLKADIVEKLQEVMEGTHTLLKSYDKAACVLHHETEPTLCAAVAAGFIGAFHHAFAERLAKGNLATNFADLQVLSNTVSNALQFSSPEEESTRKVLLNHFLQLVRLERDLGLKDLLDAMHDMSSFPAGKCLPSPDDEVILAVGYNPLSLVPYFQEARQALADLFEKDEEKDLVRLLADAKSSPITCLSLLANAVDKFYLVRALRPLTSGEKIIGNKLCKLSKSLPQTVQVLLQCLVGESMFKTPFLEIGPGSDFKLVQEATVLISLACILVANNSHDNSGNLPGDCSFFARCLFAPEQLVDMHIPACPDGVSPTVTQISQMASTLKDCHVFQCRCNRLTCLSPGRKACVVCHVEPMRPEEEDMDLGSEESGIDPVDASEFHEVPAGFKFIGYREFEGPKLCVRKLSPLNFVALRLLAHGSLECSLALGITSFDRLSQLFGLDTDIVETLISDHYQSDWYILQNQLDVGHADIFHLLNYLLLNLQEPIASPGKQPFTGDSAAERDLFEEIFAAQVSTLIESKNDINYIADAVKAANFSPGGIESMMFELPTVEEAVTTSLPLLSIFRQKADKSLNNFASQFLTHELGHNYPFLALYLEYQEKLVLLDNILPIVRWHQKLISCGSHMLHRADAIQWTAAKFTHFEESDKDTRKAIFADFCQAWGNVCEKWSIIKAVDPDIGEPRRRHEAIQLKECIIENEESDIYRVLVVLQKIQNEFLSKALKIASASDCLALSFLCIRSGVAQLPLVPLQNAINVHIIGSTWEDAILRYSQWDSRYGHGRTIDYDYGKIQQELADLLVLGKAYLLLDTGFPFFTYAGELFHSNAALLTELKQVIPQHTLPLKIQHYVHQKKASNPEYPRNLLHNLEVILYFLRKFEPPLDMAVKEFVDVWLEGTMAQSPRVDLPMSDSELLQVCHVVALFEFLEDLQGSTIINSLHEKFRKSIPGHLEESLTAFDRKALYPQTSLEMALRRFIFRWLPTLDKQTEMDELEPLAIYLDDTTLWPHRALEGGLLQTENLAKFQDHFPKEVTLQYLYCMMQRLTLAAEEKKKRMEKPLPVFKPRPGRRARVAGGQFGRT